MSFPTTPASEDADLLALHAEYRRIRARWIDASDFADELAERVRAAVPIPAELIAIGGLERAAGGAWSGYPMLISPERIDALTRLPRHPGRDDFELPEDHPHKLYLASLSTTLHAARAAYLEREEAEQKRLKLPAAEAERDELEQRMCRLEEQIEATPARTVAGILIKLKLLDIIDPAIEGESAAVLRADALACAERLAGEAAR
jgi:hypothetical protein